MTEFDWQDPDYTAVYMARQQFLENLKGNPAALDGAKAHYAENPWDFIRDWGTTFDPRALEMDRMSNIPFIMWEKQREYIEWIYDMWRHGERGLVEKCRDGGITWLSVGFAVSMFLFVDGFTTGFGSRKEELVDKRGDDKSIFEKIRFFIDQVPAIFLPDGWNERTCSAYMRIRNPETGAAIIGESGDEIGRGGRASIYFVDEAAFITRQEQVDKALSQNTNCQIDISTPNGNGNLFYKKAMKFDNTHRKFIFDWRDDPRKDDEWYEKQLEEQDEVTVAQEINRDYNASQEDVFIPAKYVAAAIDAHITLGIRSEGVRTTGFDVADTGDAKAAVNRHGSVVMDCGQLKRGNITQAIPWAFSVADQFRSDALVYDGDGMGDPSMKVYMERVITNRMRVISYHGSAGIQDPAKPIKQIRRERQAFSTGQSSVMEGQIKTNADTYVNFRAQSWMWMRIRFENTYNAIQRAKAGHVVHFEDDELISLDSSCKDLTQLVAELSRPKRIYTDNGKIKVESKKDMRARNVDSPNLADALIIAFSVGGDAILRQDEVETMEYDTYEPTMNGVM